MWTSTLFGAKNFILKFFVCLHIRWTSVGKESQFFSILCGRLLWTDLKRFWPIFVKISSNLSQCCKLKLNVQWYSKSKLEQSSEKVELK